MSRLAVRRRKFRRYFSLAIVSFAILITVISVGMIFARGDQANDVAENKSDATKGSIEDEAAKLMERMTLEDKIRQMIIVEMRSWSDSESGEATNFTTLEIPTSEDGAMSDDVALDSEISSEQATSIYDSTNNVNDVDTPYVFFSTFHYGGIIMFDENIETIEQITALNSDLQKVNAETGGVPLFISVDQEGGYVNRLPGTLMPGNMAIAATNNPDYAALSGQIIGEELRKMGFNLDFAPDADINTNPDNPIIGIRSYGDDPEKVGEYATAFSRGLAEANVAGSAKHFPGHGDTVEDSHVELPVVNRSLEDLMTRELIPFRKLIETDVDMIMTAHIVLPEIEKDDTFTLSDGTEMPLPATLSNDVITKLLREQMGYTGVVVTDSLQMAAIQDNFTPRLTLKYAINAGVDMLLAPYNINSVNAVRAEERLVADVAAMVNMGEIPIERIDESVKRILTLKLKRGLMERDYIHQDRDAESAEALRQVRSANNLATESDMAEDAVTVHHGADLLPLDQNLHIYAMPCSEYQDEIIRYTFSNTNMKVDILDRGKADSLAAASVPSVLVITTCNTGRVNMLEEALNHSLIAVAHDKGIRSVVISTGLPYDVDDYPDADVVLAVYNPGLGFPGGPYPENIPAGLRVLFGVATSRHAGQGVLPVKLK
ncbi:hypothetical protein IKE72_02865 [Candidatus Saccharibacteria bacterium]|nr:hypothetical protein [Candidatus Saccharibacteria bacterium]